MNNYWLLFFGAGGILATALYLVALKTHIMAWVDLVWSLGVGLGALAYYCFATDHSLAATCGLLISGVWSLRLSLYLLRDRALSGCEDSRYAYLKNYWGPAAKRNFYGLFLMQLPLAALFLLPIQTALVNNPAPLWLYCGLVLALVGIGGECWADYQLKAFKRESAGKLLVCRDGLWRYSRHPNYFFEWLHWWGYVCLAIGSPVWGLSLIGPLAMYLFLRYLTGIPFAERASLARRGEAYRQYQATTNLFFPWRPQTQKR